MRTNRHNAPAGLGKRRNFRLDVLDDLVVEATDHALVAADDDQQSHSALVHRHRRKGARITTKENAKPELDSLCVLL